jgi:uncharacterized protein YkwD
LFRTSSFLLIAFLFSLTFSALSAQEPPIRRSDAEQLMALANQARARVGSPPLRWDPALAEAARKHTLRMISEGPIAHVYPGELELSERAGLAGAHFDLVEENIAVGPDPAEIQDAWMHSKGHRENMLNPQVDRVGIAVIAARGVLYATADFSRGVQSLTDAQVEARIAALIAPSGVKVLPSHELARAACTADRGLPLSARGAAEPSFVMRWQDSDISHLPRRLADQLATGKFRQAAVGSCQPNGDAGTFTAYRIAVLLY